MYNLSCVAVLVVILAFSSEAFMHDSNTGRAPMCSSSTKPCRLLVSVGTFGGATIESNGAETCTCSPPYQCPQNWNRARHVVSRKVVSTTFNITLQMMFCRPVEPLAFCRRGRISIELKGSMHMPQDITAFNCRCRRRQPLMLAERRFGADYMTHHSYMCANHMRVCSEEAQCMTMDDYSTRYNCKCREGLHCRAQSRTEGRCTP